MCVAYIAISICRVFNVKRKADERETKQREEKKDDIKTGGEKRRSRKICFCLHALAITRENQCNSFREREKENDWEKKDESDTISSKKKKNVKCKV